MNDYNRHYIEHTLIGLLITRLFFLSKLGDEHWLCSVLMFSNIDSLIAMIVYRLAVVVNAAKVSAFVVIFTPFT